MSFNSKQIKTIKFLLIIVVILLVLFIAYVFLGKKMIEGYDPSDCNYGEVWDWANGGCISYDPPAKTTDPVTYDWSHVINPTQYPAYVPSKGLTGQLTPPPYNSSNIPRINEAPVINTPAPVINTPAPVINTPAPVINTPAPVINTPAPVINTPAPVINTPAPVINTPAPVINTPAPANKNTPATYDREYDEKTSAPALYDSGAYEKTSAPALYDSGAYEKTSAPAIVNKTPSPLYDWSHVVNAYMYPEYVNSIAVTQQPNRPPYDSSNIPSKKGETPVNDTPAPAPVNNTPAPVNNTPAPVNNTPAPVNNTPAPVNNTPAGVTGATGANVYLLPSSFNNRNPNYSLYGNNNLLEQQQRLLQQTQSQLQQSQLEQEQMRWQSRLQGQGQGLAQEEINNVRGSSNAPKKKICYAPYKNEKDCENAGYLWDSMKEKCRKSDTNKSRTKEKCSTDTNANKNNNVNSYNSYNNDDKYILKTQIVPPVCPACPSYKCGSEPQKLDNSILDDETNNNLLTANNLILNERNFAKSIKTNDSGRFPMPLLADFSQFM